MNRQPSHLSKVSLVGWLTIGLLMIVWGGDLFAVEVAAQSKSTQSESPQSKSARRKAIALEDLNGVIHKPFADEATKATVLLFVSEDCPIANSFQPAMREIYEAYAETGIQFFMVHSTTITSAEAVEKHVVDFEIKMPVVLDLEQSVGRMVEATTTPEAIVIDPNGEIRYRGLINDRYAGFGKKRPKAKNHYLTAALDALLAGEPIANESTKPVGCKIYYPRR